MRLDNISKRIFAFMLKSSHVQPKIQAYPDIVDLVAPSSRYSRSSNRFQRNIDTS